jgi:hypothetical protein
VGKYGPWRENRGCHAGLPKRRSANALNLKFG